MIRRTHGYELSDEMKRFLKAVEKAAIDRRKFEIRFAGTGLVIETIYDLYPGGIWEAIPDKIAQSFDDEIQEELDKQDLFYDDVIYCFVKTAQTGIKSGNIAYL